MAAGVCALMLLTSLASLAAPPAADDPWAPFESTWFDTLSTQQGLPYSITTALAQDRRGLVWIGTMGGLVRYDGAHMQVFDVRDNTASSNGLPDAYVRCLLALPDGGMLIGTNAGGLARFDPQHNRFKVYPVGPGGTADRKIYALSSDHARGVWIATDRGIDHLDLGSDKIRHLAASDRVAPRNFTVFQDRAGNLWLGNDDGLYVRNKGAATFTRPTHVDAAAAAVLNTQIWAISEGPKGRIWVGSGQVGAAWREPDGRWNIVPGFSITQADHQLPTVRAFLAEDTGQVWIATDGHGLLSYRPGDKGVRMIVHDAAIPSSLPGDPVRALLADRTGDLWVATDLGVARTALKPQTAFAIMPTPFNPLGLGGTNIHSILVDRRGRIWLGMEAGKVDVIDLAAGSMHHLHLRGSQRYRDVGALAEDADGTIWVGSQGLASVNPDTLEVSDSVLPALDRRPVLSLLDDGDSLLVGTYEGVFRYSKASGEIDHFQHVAGDPRSLASDTVWHISRIGSAIWYATTHGVSVAPAGSATTHGFVHLAHRAGDRTSLPQDYVSSVNQDGAGRVWVSTFGGIGVIDHFVPGGPYSFRTINEANGLANDKVNAVVPDHHGRLWASMSNTITVIDPRNRRVHNLDARDGLRIRSYVNVAAARTRHDYVLFGGLGGLTVIRANAPAQPSPPAQLRVTNAIVGNTRLPYAMLPDQAQAITLDAHKRSMQVDFALLDFRAPQQTVYSYRMQGFDNDWNSIAKGSLPSAIYTNLPHGRYQLHLRAVTHGMYPRTIQTTIAVTVKPRWYETTLARLVALLALIAVMIWLVQLRTRLLRAQARRLQHQVDARTQDLQAANRRLDHLAGTDELTGVFNRRRFLSMVEQLRHSETPQPMCMALLDLDRFKQVNDTYGHLAGDAVIRAVIDVIQQHCRPNDLVGRYGGEELLLCLPGLDMDQAMLVEARIRAAVADTIVMWDDQPIAVTVSIGVTALHPGEPIEQWLARADTALYDAKNSGRDRCARVD